MDNIGGALRQIAQGDAENRELQAELENFRGIVEQGSILGTFQDPRIPPRLTVLNLSGSIDVGQVEGELGKILKEAFQNLERLNLSSTKISTIPLGTMNVLTHLDLSRNNIWFEHFSHLRFNDLPALQNLDFSHNHIGQRNGDGVLRSEEARDALKRLPATIRTVNLSHNRINDVFIQGLQDFLNTDEFERMLDLVRIDFSNNDVEKEHARLRDAPAIRNNVIVGLFQN